MAWFTKTHQVVIIVSAAFGNIDDVMNFGCGSKVPIFETPLAERMRGDIDISNLSPMAVKSFGGVGITKMLVVIPIISAGMLFAVCLGCQVWAAGVRAYFHGFAWHRDLLSSR